MSMARRFSIWLSSTESSNFAARLFSLSRYLVRGFPSIAGLNCLASSSATSRLSIIAASDSRGLSSDMGANRESKYSRMLVGRIVELLVTMAFRIHIDWVS